MIIEKREIYKKISLKCKYTACLFCKNYYYSKCKVIGKEPTNLSYIFLRVNKQEYDELIRKKEISEYNYKIKQSKIKKNRQI